MSKNKFLQYSAIVGLNILYYYYRIITAVFRPSKPVMAFMFWVKDTQTVRRTFVFLIAPILFISIKIFFGWIVAILLIILLVILNVIMLLIQIRRNKQIKEV